MSSPSSAGGEQFRLSPAEAARSALPLRLSAPAEEVLARRLQLLGLSGVAAVRTHTNRNVMVSLTGNGVLRVHREYAHAPDRILQAIVRFVARGRSREAQLAAKRVLLSWPVSSADDADEPTDDANEQKRTGVAQPRRRVRRRPEDAPVLSRLESRWAEFNKLHFGGSLRPIPIELSARMRTRLGHLDYHQRTRRPTRIVLSRRMVSRGEWSMVEDTLLHEMVHQWQGETGRPIDHGGEFRRKAREVGIEPRAVVDVTGR